MQITQETFDQLKRKYRSHAKVAEALGISPRHYHNARSGKQISDSLKKLIAIVAASNSNNHSWSVGGAGSPVECNLVKNGDS